MKPNLPLFQTRFEAAITGFVLLLIFLISLTFQFFDYQEFKSRSWATIRGEIVNIAPLKAKNGREYRRLRIRGDYGVSVNIIFWPKDELSLGERVGVRVQTKKIDFKSFLSKRVTAPVILVWHNENVNIKSRVNDYIKKQHNETNMQEFYAALFLAKPISKALRASVQRWGVSHLIAISGYHLGFIFAFLYTIFSPIYRFFQNRYFPYRNSKWDISIIIFAFLAYYLLLIDIAPSFLRSYVMGVFGFIFFSRGISVLNFQTLGLCVAFLIALFPHLLLSIGFILSVSGVFYIFVFLKHFSKLKIWQTLICLNFWLFIAMNPIVHFWFGVVNIQQFAAIPLSILFAIFYPLAGFLHLIGQGSILDTFMLGFLNFETPSTDIYTPMWVMLLYILLSFLAIFRKVALIPIAIIGISYFIPLF